MGHRPREEIADDYMQHGILMFHGSRARVLGYAHRHLTPPLWRLQIRPCRHVVTPRQCPDEPFIMDMTHRVCLTL
jgi:hypothetical protein